MILSVPSRSTPAVETSGPSTLGVSYIHGMGAIHLSTLMQPVSTARLLRTKWGHMYCYPEPSESYMLNTHSFLMCQKIS